MKDQLEGLVNQMVERGIYFDEAIGEFEKRFIKRVLDRANGNQSRAAQLLGIHRNSMIVEGVIENLAIVVGGAAVDHIAAGVSLCRRIDMG